MSTDAQTFADFLRDFEETIRKATEDLNDIYEAEASSHKPGKWSPKQILGHLIDSAANNHLRFVRAQLANDFTFPGYEQERWVDVQRYDSSSWTDLVQLWSYYNLHLLHLMS